MAPPIAAARAPRPAEGAVSMPRSRPRVADPLPDAPVLREDGIVLGLWCLTLAAAGVAAGWLLLS